MSGQFHSCAEETLQFLLKSLSNKELQDTLFEVLTQLVENIVYKIHSKNSELFWNTLTTELKHLFETNASVDSDVEKHIDFLLQMCGTALEYRQGKFLHSNRNFVESFITLNVEKLSQSALLTYCKVTVLLLLSENIKLTQENASSLTRKIINFNNEEIFLYFIDNIVEYSGFEALILPTLLKLCLKNDLDQKYLYVLAKIITQKSPLCSCGINLNMWKKYPVDFGNNKANCEILKILERNIICSDLQKLITDHSSTLSSLVCLPHIAVSIPENVKENLLEFIIFLCENIKTQESHQFKLLLFLLQVALETLIHASDEKYLLKCCEPLLDAVLPLSTKVDYLSSLKVLDLLFTALSNQENIVQMEIFLRLHEVLQNNFCSPYHEVNTIFDNRRCWVYYR